MKQMAKILFSTTEETNFRTEMSVTILRLASGLFLALGHGLGKVPPSEKFVEGVTNLGFPLPEFFAWSAGLAEAAGGLLLAFGLLTKPASFFVAVTMAVAAFGQHAADPFKNKELALLYLVISICFCLRGAGRHSLDHLLSKKWR